MNFIDKLENNEQTLGGSYIPHDVFYIAPTLPQPGSLLYQISRAGIVCRTPPDFSIARHNLYPFHTIHCVISGRGTVQVQNSTIPVSRGDLFLLPALEAHHYCSDTADPLGLVWIEFCGGDSQKLVQYAFQQNGPIFRGQVFQKVLELCTSLLYQPLPLPVDKTSCIIHELLVLLYMTCPQQMAQQDLTMQRVFAYIDSHLQESLKLNSIAKVFGYNATYFSTFFAQNAGMYFSKYLLQRRIHQACHLLTTTNWPIEQIAYALGFCDASHFAQRFRASEHISPLQYRKKNSHFSK